jgi:glycerol kinase
MPRMPEVLAIDAGTTGVTGLVVDERGEVVARGYREFAQSFPRPGWVEHDPDRWWDAMIGATGEAIAASGVDPADLAAVGITNQRETTVVWERDGLRPVHPAIVWQDRRTAPLCETLRAEGWDEPVRARTGLVIDPYFSGTKLAWILDEVSGVRAEAEAGRLAFGTVDCYLMARLTGGSAHITDRTNASRTMLFDIHTMAWDEELLERLRIPHQLLPAVMPSCGTFGLTDPDRFHGVRVPVSGIAGDQQAALFGQACFDPGTTKNTYGTGSFVLMHAGETAPEPPEGLVVTLAASPDERPAYALEGSIFVTGAAIQWLRDGLGLIASSEEAGPLAASVPDTGGVAFVPALTGLGAPWWDPHARGTIVGITRGTTRAHVVRAAVEAMAYQTKDVVDAMVRGAGLPLVELRVDGGASVMDELLQLQADLLEVPVLRARSPESTALGAAYLAGLGEGLWDSPQQIAERWEADRAFHPAGDAGTANGYARWLRAVERARDWEDSD